MSDERLLVFVYGTLKRGGANHLYLVNQRFLGETRTQPGFRLYDLGGYPGMIAHIDDRQGVAGEVWSIDARTLQKLDVLEGLAEGLYRRERIALLSPFENRRIETYLYARSIEGRRDLGGVWKE
jgi:gamma-glutamylaminecyclotransferase